MKNPIKYIFKLCGFTVIPNFMYRSLKNNTKHWIAEYERISERYDNYIKFVKTDIMPDWDKTKDAYSECLQLNKEIQDNNTNILSLCDKYQKILNEQTAKIEKLIHYNDLITKIINRHNLTSEINALVDTDIKPINTIIKENYRQIILDCGVVIDRLMGEMIASGNYTEEDIAKAIGIKEYQQIQEYLPGTDFKAKYSEC